MKTIKAFIKSHPLSSYFALAFAISWGGLHPDHIGRLERGDWKGGTRIDNIRKLAEALEVDPAELVE